MTTLFLSFSHPSGKQGEQQEVELRIASFSLQIGRASTAERMLKLSISRVSDEWSRVLMLLASRSTAVPRLELTGAREGESAKFFSLVLADAVLESLEQSGTQEEASVFESLTFMAAEFEL